MEREVFVALFSILLLPAQSNGGLTAIANIHGIRTMGPISGVRKHGSNIVYRQYTFCFADDLTGKQGAVV